jgi:hypothetical protein
MLVAAQVLEIDNGDDTAAGRAEAAVGQIVERTKERGSGGKPPRGLAGQPLPHDSLEAGRHAGFGQGREVGLRRDERRQALER